MKKVLTFLLMLCLSFGLVLNVSAASKKTEEAVNTTATNDDVVEAESDKVYVYIFSKENCPYCKAAHEYFSNLKKDKNYKDLFEIVEYQVWDASWQEDEEVYNLYSAVVDAVDGEAGAAPFVIIGNKYHITGFSDEYDKDIKKALKSANEDEDYVDVVQKVLRDPEFKVVSSDEEEEKSDTLLLLGIGVLTVGLVGIFVFFARKDKSEN